LGLGFTGWELPEEERWKLAERFPPAYAVDPDVPHYVTFGCGVNADSPLPAARSGFVVGTDHAFDHLGFERPIFSNALGNIRSRRVKERTGPGRSARNRRRLLTGPLPSGSSGR
jgi:hypothetical protein